MERDKTADRLWAWLTEYPDKTIGTVGAMMPGLGMVPLVTRDERLAFSVFHALARKHKESTGQRVWLRCYHNFTDEAEVAE